MEKNDFLQTPDYVFKSLGHIDLDPCAGVDTKIGDINLCDKRGEDGLNYGWNGFVFCNPPFSQKEIWAKKMIEHGNGILLLPERGSAPWFGKIAVASGSYFVFGKKINFIGGSSSNNVGSVMFIFGDDAKKRILNSGLCGHLVTVEYFKERG